MANHAEFGLKSKAGWHVANHVGAAVATKRSHASSRSLEYSRLWQRPLAVGHLRSRGSTVASPLLSHAKMLHQ